MTRTHDLTSSFVHKAEYDEVTGTATLTFADGRRFEYLNVPATAIDGLVDADSAGKFFHENIKGQYRHRAL